MKYHKYIRFILWTSVLLFVILLIPDHASGDVKPITEAQEKLSGISEEEQETLQALFTLTQEIEETEREEDRLTGEIETLQDEIAQLDESIKGQQEEYDIRLDLLEQVLVSYQKGGPASYLEILLKAEDLGTFLRSINLIRDISRNVGELLDTIDESGKKLSEQKNKLAENMTLFVAKKEELKVPMENMQRLKQEKEEYLTALAEEKVRYEEHLSNLELMWADLKSMFSGMVEEYTEVIKAGYFAMEDLNISIGFLSVKGSIQDETFNRILKEHSDLPEIVFHFHEDNVVIEVPEKNLVLEGQFILSGNSSILFVVESGSFYQMPLETDSIEELFKEGPLAIDFAAVAGDLVTIEINLGSIETREGYLDFTVKTGFPF